MRWNTLLAVAPRCLTAALVVLGCAGGAWAQADACADATPVATGVYTGDTTTLTSDGSSACQPTSHDAWFKYVGGLHPPLVEITTCGSAIDTVLSLHTGCPGLNNNAIDCNDNGGTCGTGSRMRFMADPGQTIYIRVCGKSGAIGPFVLNVQELTGPPDVYVGNLTECNQAARWGDQIALVTDSPICNSGETPLDWYGPPTAIAPIFVFNVYRLMNDRLEQIGASWAKHSQATSQEDWCNFGCAALPTIHQLGPGCSDTYNANINARQSLYAPRSEVDAWNGAYDYATSFLANPTNPNTDTQRMIQVHDADLDPALNPGATYFVECYAVAHDDSDHMNSLSHRQAVVTGGSAGGTWTFALQGPAINGPIMQSYAGASTVTIPQYPFDDGRAIVAAKSRVISPGQYHFEYAVYNHDKARAISSFAVPVGTGATVTNMGFTAPTKDGEPGTNVAWTSARQGPLLVWKTNAFESTHTSNPIGWGMTYGFWFDVALPDGPTQDDVRLGMYFPGSEGEQRGTLLTPYHICTADVDDGSGTGTPDDAVEISDLLYYLVLFEAGSPLADVDNGSGTGTRDGGVEISDLLYFLARFEVGC